MRDPQMALDVRLQRADGAPWGFRLVGGADYDLPLTIAKVEPGSVAERAGLSDGDFLLGINGVCTRLLTHEGAHDAITAAGDTLNLSVLRGTNTSTHMQAPPGHEPIPFIDIVPPSQPPEVPSPHDRTLTSSPFLLPLKPYRPFSTEPQEGIPPVENPIILSPNYHDVFKKKPKDFEPPTKFKLEVSKDFVPDGEETDDRDVTESYSKIQEAEMTSMEELNNEIDLDQIEHTAAFVVDDSLIKAVTVSEEIKQEIDYELTHITETNNMSEIARSISGVSSDTAKVSVSFLAQLIDQTADEINKRNSIKSSKQFDKKTFDVGDNVEINESRTDSSKIETIIAQNCEERSVETTEVKKIGEMLEEKHIEMVHKSGVKSCEPSVGHESKFTEISCENQEYSKAIQNVVKSMDLPQNKTQLLEHISGSQIEKETIEKLLETNLSTEGSNTNKKDSDNVDFTHLKQNVMHKNNSQLNAETKIESRDRCQNIESTAESLTTIKQRAISTANLLAEQRAYTLGLKTIPNIHGHAHSSYHYDLLLKTFFIHLTDVMVALSRIILAEGGSRSNSPMPPHRDDEVNHNISQQVFSQHNIEKHYSEDKIIDSEKSRVLIEDSSKKTSTSKFAQLSTLKTEEMTHKMDDVITEFKKDVEEQIKIQDVVETTCDIRAKSVSKIEDEVLKEKDPLEWLAKLDQTKTSTTLDESLKNDVSSSKNSTDIKHEESEILGETSNKIIYVATVEAHQVSVMEKTSDTSIHIDSSTETYLETNAETAFDSKEITQIVETSSMAKHQTETENSLLESEFSTTSARNSMIQESIQTSTEQPKALEETNISLLTQELSQSKISQSLTEVGQESITLVSSSENNEQSPQKRPSIPVTTPPETRKLSLKTEMNGYAESEPVRKLQLDTQISVASDDSDHTIVPQTPLTDEYVFRLQIHVRDLDESKAPEREPTPPEIHEDPDTAKKPKLIPHIDISIEPVRYFVDPQSKLESLDTNGNNAFPDTKLGETAPTVEPFERIVPSNSVIGETATTVNSTEKIADPHHDTIEETAQHGTKFNITALPSLPTFENNAPPFPMATEFANNLFKIASNASNVASIDSFATNIGTSASELTHGARRTSGTLVEEYIGQAIIAEECRRASLLTSAIDNTIKDIELYKQEFGIDAHQSTATQNGGFIQNGGSFTQNGSSMYTSANGSVNVHNNENAITYSVEDLGGTTQGIVDALDNGGIIDENIAKELGKPGLTEDKVAALISGESDMMKEAHVMGADFKKIKPQIDALRDSEVLKALNDELTKTEAEKKREERKWTTFLQRPHRAVPRARFGHITEPEYPQEPYKIKIVKQPKPKVAPDYIPQDFETGPLPWELRAATEPPPPPAQREEPVLVPEAGPVYLEALDNLPESEVPDLEDTGIPLPPEEPEVPEVLEAPEPFVDTCEEPEPEQEPEQEVEVTEAEAEEMEQNKMAEQILGNIQSMVDPNASMEQQLVQMRAQLAALAQLPGVISNTLQLVTEQLGQLTRTQETKEVHHSETTVTEVQEEVTSTEVMTSEVTTSEVTTSEVTESTEATTTEVSESAEKAEAMMIVRAEVTEEAVANEAKSPQVAQTREIPGAEARARKEENGLVDEQSRLEKQKKDLMAELHQEHEQRQVKQRPPRVGKPKPAFGPLVPSERPLVLPGGRRWRSEKDEFNEDFIRETLTAQAEIIQGKTKGINFRKWEKPAKSLDYLKESDVYKLVHNMDDAPRHQVERLRAVVLAESEYREDLDPNNQGSSRLYKVVQDNGAPNPRRVQTFPPPLPQIIVPRPKTVPQTASLPQACTELVLPPNLPRVVAELPPRPASRAEAVEIVTNYVDSHSSSARTTPASY